MYLRTIRSAEARELSGYGLLSTGPERSQVNDELYRSLGFFGLSDNEKKLALIVGAGLALYAFGGWAWMKKLVRK